MMKDKIYLVEKIINGKLQILTIVNKFVRAHTIMSGEKGIVTEMEVDKEYPKGIDSCEHWHYGEDRENE